MRSLSSMKVILLGAVLVGCVSDGGLEASSGSTGSVMRVVPCDDSSLPLLEETKAALMSAGMTKCAMPFGVLIGADAAMSDADVELAINVLAEILDLDMDGVVDDAAVAAELGKYKEVAWLAMPMDRENWGEQLRTLRGHVGTDIIIPDWWMRSGRDNSEAHVRAVTVEEVSHFVLQFGFSTVYPEALGVTDWTSVIARETQRAGCDWWQHPENDCPDNPSTSGGNCSGPGCDAVEFYQQVLTLRAGMEPGWHGIGFPRTKEELEEKLSDEIKAMMDDPKYHQMNRPLSFDYVRLVNKN